MNKTLPPPPTATGPTPPEASGAHGGGGAKPGSSLALVWGVVAGLALGALVLLAIVALLPDPEPGPADGQSEVTGPTGPVVPVDGGPVGDDPVPGLGNDVFIGGGLAHIAVPDGWHLVARGNRTDDPGGYAESAVLANPASRVTLAVNLLADRFDPGNAVDVAGMGARMWTSTGTEVEIGAPEPQAPFGAVAGAAVAGYRYATDASMEGQVVAAILGDGTVLLVFVDAPRGMLGPTRADWQPLRDDILRGFGA